MNNVLDLTAKLLANENIHVVRAPVATAAFDVVNRTLILPQWKEITPAIDQMLVAHEVAHALFTPAVYSDAIDSRLNFKGAKTYVNILEDARIEKLIKRRYLGIRKVFNAGYVELNEMDFFGIKGRDLASAHLMDKINLLFKVGYKCGVTFSPAEKPFVERADSLETFEEAIQLAADIHAFLQEEETRKLAEQQAQQALEPDEPDEPEDDGDQGEYEDVIYPKGIPEIDDEDTEHSFSNLVDPGEPEPAGDAPANDFVDQQANADGDREQADETASPQGGGVGRTQVETDQPEQEEVEVAEPTTNESFEQRVTELADTSTAYKYYTIEPVKFDPIVGYKELLSTINTSYETPVADSTRAAVQEFKRDTQNNVDYLVKEFEMKKAATMYKRAQISKVGSLDMRKVWSYQLNEDLFKRVTSVKQGKNHGMVFLLDWSGSMSHTINDTVDQVINLAMFCQRAGIAYQVFAFSDVHITDSQQRFHSATRPAVDPTAIDVSWSHFSLLEMFSNKMTSSEFNQMVLNLKSNRFIRTYSMNGTPLNEALVYCYHYIEQFQKMNNVEKVSFITLTDGAGGGLPAYFNSVEYSNGARRSVRHYIKDRYTKKNVEINSNSGRQTQVLIEMIKNRYNCTVLGFFITRNSRRDLVEAIRAHYDQMEYNEAMNTVERMKSEFRTNGYGSLMGTGRDELFVVPTSSTKVSHENLEIDAAANARSIASKFGKFMTTKKTSRILLNKFINYVA